MVFKPSRPRTGSREKRGLEPPERSTRLGRNHRAWDAADRSPAPAPQSKPVTHASRLVAQGLRRGWHSGLGRESWPQGQPHTDSTPIADVYVNQTSRIVRAHRRTRASAESGPAQARSVSRTALPAAERFTQTATLGDRRELGIPAHWPLSPITAECTRGQGDPSGRHPTAQRRGATKKHQVHEHRLLVADVVAA